jgi:hypothetical protein
MPSAAARPIAHSAPTSFESLSQVVPRLDSEVLRRALESLDCAARQGFVSRPELLTVIDYSLPSTADRLWVLDLEHRRVLFRERVAHGKNSGGDLAAAFSNEVGSLQTSLGLFVTEETYLGRNGYSLRLEGLEPGVNDRALERTIVMHGAPYVSDAAVAALGRLGRSFGCPAVRREIARPLIDAIKGGSVVFAFYPDETWLASSRFGERCGATAPAGALIASSTGS